MDRITINTGLEAFVLLDGIREVSATRIDGGVYFSNAPIYQGIESLAQLGAMHVRYLVRFEKHAFLLKINHFSLASGLGRQEANLNGTYHLCGNRVGASGQAFSYILQAEKEGRVHWKGGFLFATAEYGDAFNREILGDHYQKVFSCLRNGVKTDC